MRSYAGGGPGDPATDATAGAYPQGPHVWMRPMAFAELVLGSTWTTMPSPGVRAPLDRTPQPHVPFG